MKKPLILIAGPTASGKTKTSVQLAKKIGGEIISVDSMQIYKGMDIGTAKVRPEEMDGIKHYMIDEWEPDYLCSVADFKEKVNQYIEAIYAKGKIPILVGGTGFYINAILFNTQFEKQSEENKLRDELMKKVEQIGAKALHEELAKVDKASAEAIHYNNIKRVVRALEYYYETGEPISLHNQREKDKRLENESPYDYTFFALSMEREILYTRINKRIDEMMAEGLLEEAKAIYDLHLDPELTSMKAIGYKEFFPYFEGALSKEACIEQLKQDTRRYAKRQMTWFRHQADPVFIEVDQLGFDTECIVEEMLSYLNEYTRQNV